ncbi:MAG: alpha/beta fold hydrolase [Candidatus Sericytochromatia bacterium]
MDALPFSLKNPSKLLQTLAEQTRIRLQYGPEFIGDLENIEVGLTPRTCVYQEGPHSLYLYPGQAEQNTPILLVYSLINRPYIFDLRPGRSLIEFLCAQGYDVYLLDWGDPTPDLGMASLGDLVATLKRSVRKILRRHRQSQIPILGYCMGATFATLYAALEPQHVERLILLTPILGNDTGGTLQNIVAHQNLPPALLEGQLMSGRELKLFFNSVRPAQILKKERDFWQNYDQDTFMEHFLPVEKWSNDTPDLPGKAFQQLMQLCIKEDALRKGPVSLNDQVADCRKITCPVLAVVAKHDWIIPVASLQTCAEVLSESQYTPYLLNGGHIGLVVGRAAGTLWKDLIAFLNNQPLSGGAASSEK